MESRNRFQGINSTSLCSQSWYFWTCMGPRNRFHRMNSASLCSLAGRYNNPIPTRCLAPIDFFKIPTLAGRYDNLIPTRCLAPYKFFKNSSSGYIGWRNRLLESIPGLLKSLKIPCVTLVLIGNSKEEQSPYLQTFMEPRNRFRGIDFASLCNLAGRY